MQQPPESPSVGKVPCPTCDRFRWQRHVKSDEAVGEAGLPAYPRSFNQNLTAEPMPFPANSIYAVSVPRQMCFTVLEWIVRIR
ncbi:hypothetical protein MRX96_043402 [Rhipicephalus microplus]